MLKLKLQYFGHLMRRVDSLEKTLMLGGIGGRRRRGRQRMRWLDGIIDSIDVSLGEFVFPQAPLHPFPSLFPDVFSQLLMLGSLSWVTFQLLVPLCHACHSLRQRWVCSLI